MIQNVHEWALQIAEENSHLLTDYYWRNNYKNGYCHRVDPEGKTVYLHRQIMEPIPEGLVVDHCNQDRRDNRKSNLRICTQSENALNSPPRYERKYKGVYKRGEKYIARFRNIHLGTFKTEFEAAEAYNVPAREYLPYVWLNPIEDC